jgi:hypothetical protein
MPTGVSRAREDRPAVCAFCRTRDRVLGMLASASEPAGGDRRVIASASEPAGGDRAVVPAMAAGSSLPVSNA